MDECPGLLVFHEDGRIECLETQCTEPDALRHEWRATCGEHVSACGDCPPPPADVHERCAA